MMNIPRATAGCLACLLLASQVQAATVVSYFPNQDLGQFLAEQFDLASIRSSFGPRRTPALRTFADFGLRPDKASETEVIFERPGDWRYVLTIVGRRDVNRDGIEDLEACFLDQALNGGNYRAETGLLVTRYAEHGYAIALSFSLNDEACRSVER